METSSAHAWQADSKRCGSTANHTPHWWPEHSSDPQWWCDGKKSR